MFQMPNHLCPVILFALLGAVAACASSDDAEQGTRQPMSVLFIGNSYTHVNKLPQILEQLSVAAKLDTPIGCTMATVGGATLERHWKNPDFRKLLEDRKWDIIVLQEQSMRPVENPELFREYARLWSAEIKPRGAELLFYMTWARKATPEKQPIYTENYRKAAKECGGKVVPVGEAWKAVREQKPDIGLFASDGSHPSAAGSYLAACVFFATITGKSPVGLPGKFTNTDDEGKVLSKELKAEDALFLQQAAWDAVEREMGSGNHSPSP